MKQLIIPCLLLTLAACGKSSSKSSVDQKPEDVSNQGAKVTETSGEKPVEKPVEGPTEKPAAVIDSSKSEAIAVSFLAKIGDKDLLCSDKSAAAHAEGQIFNDIRLFISNLSFVDDKGIETRLVLDESTGAPNLQYVDKKGNTLALLNFLSAECAKSDATATLKTSITGKLPQGIYKEVHFQVGLPYAPMTSDLTALPASMQPSDMAWMWEHYPADFSIEMNTSSGGVKKISALTNSKKRVNTLPLDYTLAEGSALELGLQMDLGKLFAAGADSFVDGLESACNGMDPKLLSETATNCASAYKALGLEIADAKAPYEQSVFSVIKK